MKFGRMLYLSAALASLMLNGSPVFGQGGQTLEAQPKSASENAQVLATQSLLAAGNRQSSETGIARLAVKDVVLNPLGHLAFTVVGSTGRPVVGGRISLWLGSARIARAKTNSKGQVRISGLKPGLHVFQTDFTKTIVRLWSPETAPPHAVASPAIVDASDLVRGQYGYGAPMAPGLVAATVTAIGVGAAVIGKSSGSDGAAAVVPASP